jgi:hypothetical protein
LVKKAQATCEAAGTLPGGLGKECTPLAHAASAILVPPAHPDHVVWVISPEWLTTAFAGHFSVVRSWPTRVVTGSDSTLP